VLGGRRIAITGGGSGSPRTRTTLLRKSFSLLFAQRPFKQLERLFRGGDRELRRDFATFSEKPTRLVLHFVYFSIDLSKS